MPGLAGFVQYCIVNGTVDRDLYGGSRLVRGVYQMVMDYTTGIEKMMIAAIKRHAHLRAPGLFEHTVALHKGFIGLGAKMGEGWLLTSEMIELVQSGFPNIVCAQPFGCLPNHVVGKGMISKIRATYPEANITPIDYDPSATKVNQENRIKLMIAVAKERLVGADAPVPVIVDASADADRGFSSVGAGAAPEKSPAIKTSENAAAPNTHR